MLSGTPVPFPRRHPSPARVATARPFAVESVGRRCEDKQAWIGRRSVGGWMMAIHTNCQGFSRRSCLQLGLAGLLGGGFAGALRAVAAEGSARRQAKACILIWMDGGPS